MAVTETREQWCGGGEGGAGQERAPCQPPLLALLPGPLPRALPIFPRSQSALVGGGGGGGEGEYRPVPGPLWGGVIAKTDRATSARKWRWPGVLYVGRRTLRSPARKEAWRAPEPRSEDRPGGSRPRRRSQDSGRPAGGRPSTAAPQGPPSHPGRRAGTWGRGRARGGGGDGGVGGLSSAETRAPPAAGER